MSQKQNPLFSSLAMTLFLVTLFFAPLAFGTTEPWSMATVELLAAVTGLLFFFPFLKNKPVLYKTPALLPLLLLLSWMFLQCIPLPVPLVQLISPNIYQAYKPLLDVEQTIRFIPLTIHLKASLLESLRISSYVLFYVLTVQLLSSGRRLFTTVNSVTGLTLFIAFLAICQHFTAPHTIFWFRHLSGGKTAMGPWVYQNHYAGFMTMLCPVALALFFYYRPTVHYRESFREKFISMFSMPSSNIHLFLGFGIALILTSISLTPSRGGIFSASLTLVLFFILLARQQSKAHKLKLFFLLSGLVCLMVWFSWEPLINKFNFAFADLEGGIQEDRFKIWRDTMAIISDFPITGSGFGTFIDIFPGYKTLPDKLLYEHAHNDFIELFTDGGLVGFTLVAWFVLSIMIKGLKKNFSRRDTFSVMLTAGAFSGIAGLLIYGLSDFNMQNGANGLYFFFLCGLLISAGNTRHRYRTRPTLLSPVTSNTTGTITFIAISLFFILLLMVHGGTSIANRLYNEADTISAYMLRPERKVAQIAPLLKQAKRFDPVDGQYAFALASIERYHQQDKKALENYIEAAMTQPMEGAFLQAVGLMLTNSEPDKAQALLEASYRRGDQEHNRFKKWIEFLLAYDKRPEAMLIMREELLQHRQLLNTVYPLLVEYSFTQQEVIEILPKLTSSWLSYGNLANKKGDKSGSEYYFEHALDFIEQEKKVTPQSFTQVYRYYHKQKQEDKAVATLRLAIQWLPDHAVFHIQLGDYYKKEGILYRAREEYEQALIIEPENNSIKNRIKQL